MSASPFTAETLVQVNNIAKMPPHHHHPRSCFRNDVGGILSSTRSSASNACRHLRHLVRAGGGVSPVLVLVVFCWCDSNSSSSSSRFVCMNGDLYMSFVEYAPLPPPPGFLCWFFVPRYLPLCVHLSLSLSFLALLASVAKPNNSPEHCAKFVFGF